MFTRHKKCSKCNKTFHKVDLIARRYCSIDGYGVEYFCEDCMKLITEEQEKKGFIKKVCKLIRSLQ